MRRFGTPLLVLSCVAVLTLACYGTAIVRGEQFAYRDAAHFYYPLYQYVQAGWNAGQWPPLWDPEENGGMPLLGNPTAAVLYPGKLIFAALPYPIGARVYIIAHTLLAVVTMLVLLRSWETSWTGAMIGALAYAFGAPILFQYCNVIFLVGAAWAPLGFHGVDRWLRLGRRCGLLELGIALAMETLGGDPETAYLTGLCAGGYALILAKARAVNGIEQNGKSSRWWIIARVELALVIWVAATLFMARYASVVRPPKVANNPPSPLPWMSWVAPVVAAAWGAVGLVLLKRWRDGSNARAALLVPMLAGLVGAAALATMLAAAQLLPVAEFLGQTTRAAGDGPHDIYPFSLLPARVVEFVWPNVFGTPFRGNRSWFHAISNAKVWVPSLYLGGPTIVLALGALSLRSRGSAPWRPWLSMIAVASLVLSFGEYGGPLYWARLSPAVAEVVGPHDKYDTASIRPDRHLRDGDGSPYWLLATVVPGFRQFRFPSKLLTFTALTLAALAGQGWDALQSGDPRQRRRTIAWTAALLGLTLLTLVILTASRETVIAWLEARKPPTAWGPLDVPGAFAESQRGLVQGGVVLAVMLVIALRGTRKPGLAAAAVLVVLTADLALANSRYVLTEPQRLFETTPRVLEIIRDAEAKNPDPESAPYRVHRMPIWNPYVWMEQASDDRVRDFLVWERDTIQPKYGLPLGVAYTFIMGVAELYDYEWYVGGYTRPASDEVIKALGVDPSARVIAFPRRGFDMWTTRYFVLPYYANKWTDENRGFASFLERTERVYPPIDAFDGPDRAQKERDWITHHDFQVRRNLQAYPRAWVVHDVRPVKTVRGLDRVNREAPMKEILFSNDFLWRDSGLVVYDPRAVAWVEADDLQALRNRLSGRQPDPAEKARVGHYGAERIEIDASLETPGLVVVADVFYPGWTLTIDGKSAPIYRVNRMMRGAAVDAGNHRLVFTYRPLSFRAGLVVSCAGIATLAVLGVVFAVRPTTGSVDGPAPQTETPVAALKRDSVQAING